MMKILKVAFKLICAILLIAISFILTLNIAKFAIYGEYYKIKDNYCINPGLNHGAVPQGIAVDEDRDIVLTTAYMKDKSASRIYLTNSKNEQRFVSLTQNSKAFTGHVGGISLSGNYAYISDGDRIYKIALEDIQNQVGLQGVLFKNEFKFIKKHVADFFEVEERTINYYLKTHSKELLDNGYEVLSGQNLKDFIQATEQQFVNDEKWIIAKQTPKLSVFNFRSFLNLAMLITHNEHAKQIRSIILDISIATINKRTGGGTKYINSRDANYLQSAMSEQRYRKVLTAAINTYVEGTSNAKYAQITDRIYKQRDGNSRKELKRNARDKYTNRNKECL